ncbi:MAG: AAA family ATPase, partial [Lachnospiraceae bacterium]|nr:AAA family ATPase [Lachnospiraceae bacterium]
MAIKTKLPMGIEDFKRIRSEDFYYIDKTGLIRELLENEAYVNLFTRPRRFGKTLNMSMLKYFFEIGSDSTLFNGLEISKETELCAKYMGKFPVISITLKGASGRTFE